MEFHISILEFRLWGGRPNFVHRNFVLRNFVIRNFHSYTKWSCLRNFVYEMRFRARNRTEFRWKTISKIIEIPMDFRRQRMNFIPKLDFDTKFRWKTIRFIIENSNRNWLRGRNFDGKPLVKSSKIPNNFRQFCGTSAGCRRRKFDGKPLVKLTQWEKAGCGPREQHFVEKLLPRGRNLPFQEPESRHTIPMKNH